MKRKKYVYFILVIVMLISSCGKTSYDESVVAPDTTSESSIEPTDDNGEEIQGHDKLIFEINKTNNINPLTSSDENLCKTMSLLFQNIVSYTADDKVKLNLIESYTFDSETNSFLIKVKSGMKWSDGTSITADDFVYSYNTIRNAPENAYYKNVIRNITSFVKAGSDTIKVTVKNKDAGNPYCLAFPVLPKDKADEFVLQDSVHFNKLTGSGIYMVSDVSINNTLKLVDNPNDSITPLISDVEIRVTDDDETRYYGFEQNLSNVMSSSILKWSSYHTNKSVNINSFNSMDMVILGFNFNTKINNDKNFRYCVYSSIPFEQIQNSIYLGFCDSSRTLYPQNHFAYNEAIGNEKYDQLMTLDYYTKSSYAGEQLELITISENTELVKIANIIQSNLSTVGVKINVVPLSYDDYMKRIDSGDYDIYLGTYKMSVLPDYSKLISSGNYGRYENANLVTLQNNLNNSQSYEQYKTNAVSLQEIVFSEKPVIPIVHIHDALITDSNINTTMPTSFDNPYEDVANWTIGE